MIHPSLQILELKAQLADTDYKAIKHSEGLISEDDYAPIKEERQIIRAQINALEMQLTEANACAEVEPAVVENEQEPVTPMNIFTQLMSAIQNKTADS